MTSVSPYFLCSFILFRSISLSSLYSLLKSRLCPYFYLCSYQVRAGMVQVQHGAEHHCPSAHLFCRVSSQHCSEQQDSEAPAASPL